MSSQKKRSSCTYNSSRHSGAMSHAPSASTGGCPRFPTSRISDFGRLADILAGEGIEEIDILGGEPTLHPDLISLIGIACEKGLRVSMSTNGSDIQSLISLSGIFDRNLLTIGLSLNDKLIDDSMASYVHVHKPLLKSVCASDRFLPESAASFIAMPDIRYYAIFMDALHSSDLRKCLSFPQFYRTLQDLREQA